MENENLKFDEYEKSLTTTYRSKIWAKFIKAVKEYELIQPDDKICVCISGGKDSMLLAKLFSTLHKHSDFHFDVEYIVMNPGYNPENLQLIKKNLELLNIPAKIFETNIFDVANAQDKSPCYLCARMRRGALYNIAESLGCNKIALGHHYDDVIETTLMNMLHAGSFQTMLPKLHADHFTGMELIRPMYLIREQQVNNFKNRHNLRFIQCACRFTENYADNHVNSARAETKKLIHQLAEQDPLIEKNIFMAASNVNMDMILGYKSQGVKHSFLEEYENKGKKENK